MVVTVIEVFTNQFCKVFANLRTFISQIMLMIKLKEYRLELILMLLLKSYYKKERSVIYV